MFLLDAMRSMLVEVMRDNGQSESVSAEGSAAVGESPEGVGPTAIGRSPAGAGPTAVREVIFVTKVYGTSERRNTEKLCSCRDWSREGSARPAKAGEKGT